MYVCIYRERGRDRSTNYLIYLIIWYKKLFWCRVRVLPFIKKLCRFLNSISKFINHFRIFKICFLFLSELSMQILRLIRISCKINNDTSNVLYCCAVKNFCQHLGNFFQLSFFNFTDYLKATILDMCLLHVKKIFCFISFFIE